MREMIPSNVSDTIVTDLTMSPQCSPSTAQNYPLFQENGLFDRFVAVALCLHSWGMAENPTLPPRSYLPPYAART